MTNSERDQLFVIRWNGGPLLPEYASNTTLTEPARDAMRLRDDFGDIRTQTRYTPDQKARVRGMYLAAMSPSAIGKQLQMPLATVKHMVEGLAEARSQLRARGAVGRGTVLHHSEGVSGGRSRHDRLRRSACSGSGSASL